MEVVEDEPEPDTLQPSQPERLVTGEEQRPVPPLPSQPDWPVAGEGWEQEPAPLPPSQPAGLGRRARAGTQRTKGETSCSHKMRRGGDRLF